MPGRLVSRNVGGSPSNSARSLLLDVATGEEEPIVVGSELAPQPLGVRHRADEHEQRLAPAPAIARRSGRPSPPRAPCRRAARRPPCAGRPRSPRCARPGRRDSATSTSRGRRRGSAAGRAMSATGTSPPVRPSFPRRRSPPAPRRGAAPRPVSPRSTRRHPRTAPGATRPAAGTAPRWRSRPRGPWRYPRSRARSRACREHSSVPPLPRAPSRTVTGGHSTKPPSSARTLVPITGRADTIALVLPTSQGKRPSTCNSGAR